MEPKQIQKILSGNSKALIELREKAGILEGYLELIRKLNSLPQAAKQTDKKVRNLFQMMSIGMEMGGLENL